MYSVFVSILWLFISHPAIEVDYYADLSGYVSLSQMPFEDSRYFREKKAVVFGYYGDLCAAGVDKHLDKQEYNELKKRVVTKRGRIALLMYYNFIKSNGVNYFFSDCINWMGEQVPLMSSIECLLTEGAYISDNIDMECPIGSDRIGRILPSAENGTGDVQSVENWLVCCINKGGGQNK